VVAIYVDTRTSREIRELQDQQGKHNSKEGVWNLDAGILHTIPILSLLARTYCLDATDL
jgi:hypothetical protein